MKTKYLLSALALPLLAACTQDEFDVQSGMNGNAALQDRIEVGKVAFTTGADTRFDFGDAEKIGWEDGQVFGLFLMDDWNEKGNAMGNGERPNANETDFRDQIVWNNMYSLHNYTQSNIPFKFKRATEEWSNDDALVEGNYFALAPAKTQKSAVNEGATAIRNRRDVWVYINPVQKFGNQPEGVNRKMTGGIEQNQFFLGYKQLYRDQALTDGEQLRLPLQMRPILGMVDLTIRNTSPYDFRVEKIVIKRLDNEEMPTLAYVRPDGNTKEDFPEALDGKSMWTVNNPNGDPFEWGPAFAQPYDRKEITDECGNKIDTYLYNEATWTRSAARSVVKYSYPGEKGFTPYGLTGEEAKAVYEYTLDFTGQNEEGETVGTELKSANDQANNYLHAYIALPHSMYLKEYEIVVYGKQYNSSLLGENKWEDGIIIPKVGEYVEMPNPGEESDGRFTLQNVDLASQLTYVSATIEFDRFRVEKRREATVSNAADLLRYLKMYEGESYNAGKSELFYITTTGDFTITQDLYNYVKDLNNSKADGKKGNAVIYFQATKNGKLIFPNGLANDAIDLFYYTKNVKIVNEGTQVINKPILKDYSPLYTLATAIQKQEWMKKHIGTHAYNDGVAILDKLEPALAAMMTDSGIYSIVNKGVLTINADIEVAQGQLFTEESNSKENSGIFNEEGAILDITNATIAKAIDIEGGQMGTGAFVRNQGALTMKAAEIAGTLLNEKEANVSPLTVEEGGSAAVTETKVTTVLNYNSCVECGRIPAMLIINEDAKLSVVNGVNGNEEFGYEGTVKNYGSFVAEYQFGNYDFIINGSDKLAGNNTTVSMSGIVNYAGSQEVAVTYDKQLDYEEGIHNFCALSVENYGYIYQANAYATINIVNDDENVDYHDRGVIENTVHGNIAAGEIGETPTKYQVIIYTVEKDEADIVDITDWLEKYHDYNKVVLKVGTLISGSYGTFDKLHFADEDGNAIVGEVEFASAETFIDGRETSAVGDEIVHLAVNYVKVNGTVRLEHGSELRVGQYEPNIDCTVYGIGKIEVQDGCRLEGMGAADVLDCRVNAWGSGAIGAEFETGSENIHVGSL